MKRKDENKIVIRVEMSMVILFCMYSIFFILFTIIAVITKAPIIATILSAIMVIVSILMAIKYFKICEIIQLNELHRGIIIVENRYNQIYDFKLDHIRYKIFEKEKHILLQDDNHTVLLSKSKKLLFALKKVGIINTKNEL